MKLEEKTIIGGTFWDAKDTCRTPDQRWVYLSREAEQHFPRLFASTYCSSWILQKSPGGGSLIPAGIAGFTLPPLGCAFHSAFRARQERKHGENSDHLEKILISEVPGFLWLFWVVCGGLCWSGRAAEDGNRAGMDGREGAKCSV